MLHSLSVVGTVSILNMTGLDNLYKDTGDNQGIQLLQVQQPNPETIVATVNTTKPFILVTDQILDNYWVADINGQQLRPTSLYLGLKGFLINQTGQFTVTITYEPQKWFNYCLLISVVTITFVGIALIYINRKIIKESFKKHAASEMQP